MSIQFIVHYSFHFLAPLLFALFFQRDKRIKACLIMLSTMLVDLDHLFATPIFDPNRCSIGFHPLHSYWAIGFYTILCVVPLKRFNLPWWIRPIGIGCLFHMFTDFQDYYFWNV